MRVMWCRVMQIIDGLDMISVGRVVSGATNPVEAAPGSIRGDFGVSIYRCAQPTSLPFTSLLFPPAVRHTTPRPLRSPLRSQLHHVSRLLCARSNLVHTSDSAEAAKREIDLWFAETEHVHWRPIFKSTLFDGDPVKGNSYPPIPHMF